MLKCSGKAVFFLKVLKILKFIKSLSKGHHYFNEQGHRRADSYPFGLEHLCPRTLKINRSRIDPTI